MTWTAVCERNKESCVIVFHSLPDVDDAYKNIKAVVQTDGYRVIALIKGDHAAAFYGIDATGQTIISEPIIT